MTNSLFNYNNKGKWITDCGTFGTAFTFPFRSFPPHKTFSILFNFFQAKLKDEKGQACLSALDNSGHRLYTKPSLSICSTSPCWQRWTILDNVHGIEKNRQTHTFLGTFLKIIEAGTTSGNENAWTTMTKKKKKNERRWMQRIRHDEKQWANQTYGCFSVSVLLTEKIKEIPLQGSVCSLIGSNNGNSLLYPTRLYSHTHTHCLKAVGQCWWWWWWSLKSGNDDDDAPVVVFLETLSDYYLPEILPLYILRWATSKSSFFYLKPFLSLATLNLFRHFFDWTEKIEKEWKCVRVAIWSVLPPSHSFHCCSPETFFRGKMCVCKSVVHPSIGFSEGFLKKTDSNIDRQTYTHSGGHNRSSAGNLPWAHT